MRQHAQSKFLLVCSITVAEYTLCTHTGSLTQAHRDAAALQGQPGSWTGLRLPLPRYLSFPPLYVSFLPSLSPTVNAITTWDAV